MASSADTLRLVRKTHLYFGLFISPALLFFAFTGALQTFSLHETTQGSSYKPPRWAVVWGQIHKKQTWIVPVHKDRPGNRPAEAKAPEARQPELPVSAATNLHTDASVAPAAARKSEGGETHRGHANGALPPGSPGENASAANAPSQPAAGPGATPAPSASAAPSRAGDPGSAHPRSHLPLKIFFLIVSIGLFTSTLTGIYMAYKYDRNKMLVTALLVVGAILPLLLLPF